MKRKQHERGEKREREREKKRERADRNESNVTVVSPVAFWCFMIRL